MSTGNFLEILSQQILVGIILVGRLGVGGSCHLSEAWVRGSQFAAQHEPGRARRIS